MSTEPSRSPARTRVPAGPPVADGRCPRPGTWRRSGRCRDRSRCAHRRIRSVRRGPHGPRARPSRPGRPVPGRPPSTSRGRRRRSVPASRVRDRPPAGHGWPWRPPSAGRRRRTRQPPSRTSARRDRRAELRDERRQQLLAQADRWPRDRRPVPRAFAPRLGGPARRVRARPTPPRERADRHG
jgi:hypothetical protein